MGYASDFFKWEEVDEYKYLLMCNTLPHAWYMPAFANALQHWTVEEYFEKLELYLSGEVRLSGAMISTSRLVRAAAAPCSAYSHETPCANLSNSVSLQGPLGYKGFGFIIFFEVERGREDNYRIVAELFDCYNSDCG